MESSPRHCTGTCAFALAVLLLGALGLASENAPEDELRADFLQNLTKFVEWPRDADTGSTPVVIGVVGNERLFALLEEIAAGPVVGRRPLTARALAPDDELEGCDMVFVSASIETPESIFARAEGKSILTVGEVDRFTDGGGIIGFRLEKKRARFEIDLAAARGAGLHISSQLLKLADVVRAAP